jgi:hypothetical protein
MGDLPVRHNHRVRRAPCVVPSSSFPSARSRRRLAEHLGDAAGLIGARDVECGFPDRDLAVAQDPDAALAMSLQADSSARDERMRCCRHNRGRNTTLRKKDGGLRYADPPYALKVSPQGEGSSLVSAASCRVSNQTVLGRRRKLPSCGKTERHPGPHRWLVASRPVFSRRR